MTLRKHFYVGPSRITRQMSSESFGRVSDRKRVHKDVRQDKSSLAQLQAMIFCGISMEALRKIELSRM